MADAVCPTPASAEDGGELSHFRAAVLRGMVQAAQWGGFPTIRYLPCCLSRLALDLIVCKQWLGCPYLLMVSQVSRSGACGGLIGLAKVRASTLTPSPQLGVDTVTAGL